MGPGEAWKVFKNTFQAPEKYLYTLSGAGEVFIYTYLAPERPEKPEKYLYTPVAEVVFSLENQRLSLVRYSVNLL